MFNATQGVDALLGGLANGAEAIRQAGARRAREQYERQNAQRWVTLEDYNTVAERWRTDVADYNKLLKEYNVLVAEYKKRQEEIRALKAGR
jgi:hypothetical protein